MSTKNLEYFAFGPEMLASFATTFEHGDIEHQFITIRKVLPIGADPETNATESANKRNNKLSDTNSMLYNNLCKHI